MVYHVLTQLRTSYTASGSKQNTGFRGQVIHVLRLKIATAQFSMLIKAILNIWLPHVS